MLLGIASGNSFLDNDVPLGIEPGIGNNGAVSPDIASMAKQAFYDFGERPVWSEHTYAATGERRFQYNILVIDRWRSIRCHFG
jgi:nuclear pore complex protein Nup155